MKVKKCPYCGKRVSYFSAFSSRRKGEFICDRCGKESRVRINKKIYLAFALAVVVSCAVMAGWIFEGLVSNPLGIILVAVPLLLFASLSPKFLYYEPLKKYKKSMEAKRAGIAYSDNLASAEIDEIEKPFAPATDTSNNFNINSDVFNKIKAERNEARAQLQDGDIISDSAKIDTEESFVPVINNVSENHVSTDAPLRKIHSETPHSISRNHHYIPIESDSHETEHKKQDTNRYSANRKF